MARQYFRSGWGVAVSMAWIGLSSAASAQEGAAPQPPAAVVTEVKLKNGESVRGTLVNVKPGDRVIVIIAGKESAIPWGDIAAILGDSGKDVSAKPADLPPQPPAPPQVAPPAAPPVALPVAPQTPAPQVPTVGMPFLHVETEDGELHGLELLRVDGELSGSGVGVGAPYAPNITKYICREPCDKVVDGREGHRFYFAGPGMIPTRQFRLDQAQGIVTARVAPVSAFRFVGGILLSTLGGTATLGGGMLVALGAAEVSKAGSSKSDYGVITAGGVVTAAGLSMLVGGIMLLSKGTTKVEFIAPNGADPGVSFADGVIRY